MGIYTSGRIEADSSIRNWLKVGLIWIAVMVVVGGITRLTESGLSIVDWRPVTGFLPPLNEAQWQQSFDMYKNSPEFKDINSHFTISDYKQIYFWEYLHRLLGRLLGFVFIIPFLYFLIRGRVNRKLIPRLLILLGLGAFQGFLGWYMVASGLIDIPRVSHYRLAAHLSTAFLTICYVYWLLKRTGEQPEVVSSSGSTTIRKWSVILLVLLAIQIIYGAFVAGKDLGLIHSTWPSMDGYFIHPAATSLEPVYKNFLINNSMIQFIHRTLGILVFFTVLAVWLELRRTKSGSLKRLGNVLMLLVLIQFILGVLNLLWHVPVSLGVLHQFGALILLLGTLELVYRRPFIRSATSE